MIPKHTAPAQEWINAGLAVATKKRSEKDLRQVSFEEARANALVHLTGRGAEALDREAKQHAPNAGPHH
ncbi:MAG: hypothetical protein JO270_25000 [Acidobacteriaceae bacterium]|nr:hypothetical protein [Acidobacteriaceae bacterium]MBV8570707.1 hypothetical protein [Acidobacteriaceae bacterium]